ncbi:hypothetical protein TWF694_001981 [Orbilia ellipsospora]|uniref:Calcineurin-like phosphoesterase domain-containing protein n=1 Tax=Orbilia ellipsospora TaxID=2528407 RepID=A0AAV9X5D4_9PEZI
MAGLDAILNRKPSTKLERFMQSPEKYIAKTLYALRPNRAPSDRKQSLDKTIKIVCISDTHNHKIIDIATGDILIHAGDLTERGSVQEVQNAVDWLDTLPHTYKIVIAGNHELCLDPSYKYKKTTIPPTHDFINWKSLTYLNDASVVINVPGKSRAIKIYGCPWTPKQGNSAFQYPRQENFWEDRVPNDVDILVSHGPPRHHLDIHAGCISLLLELWRVRPQLHVFGHIHESRGRDYLDYSSFQGEYEMLCDGKGSVFTIFFLFLGLIASRLLRLIGMRQEGPKTILINAAMVKGLKNELIDSGGTSVSLSL